MMALSMAVRLRRRWVAAASLILSVLVVAHGSRPERAWASTARSGAATPSTERADADTLSAADLIEPEQLAVALTYPAPRRPTMLQVGFKVLYRTGHIAGSHYVGPASKPEGLAALKRTLMALRKEQPVVLYCGCCPWKDCPNVRPAFQEANALGLRNVKLLFIGKNLQEDWISKGLPMREGEP